MSAKHTPGPWRVGDAGATVFGPKTDAPAPKTIAHVGKLLPLIVSEETHENARLIAAAPTLYNALESAAELLESLGEINRDAAIGARDARAALAQAKEQEV